MLSIRRLTSVEYPLLAPHLLRLDATARRFRFGGVTAGDETITAYCRSIDWSSSIAVGHFDGDDLRGVAQIVAIRPDGSSAPYFPFSTSHSVELAITVEQPYRRRGFGAAMMKRLLVIARNRQVRDLYMYCAAENRAIQRLARKVGVELSLHHSEIVGHARLAPPDQFSAYSEYADDAAQALDRFAYWFRVAFPVSTPHQ